MTTVIEPVTAGYPTRERPEELADLAFAVHSGLDSINIALGLVDRDDTDPPPFSVELFGWVVHYGRSLRDQAAAIIQHANRLIGTADSLVQETVIEPACLVREQADGGTR